MRTLTITIALNLWGEVHISNFTWDRLSTSYPPHDRVFAVGLFYKYHTVCQPVLQYTRSYSRSISWRYHHCDNKNTDWEYHFTFSALGEKASTFLFHDQKKRQTSLSVIRYPVLTQLIESHVSNHNDIVYNNANKPLKFEDVPSLEKYHSIIFSNVNAQVSEHCIASDSVSSVTDTPPVHCQLQ